MNERKRLIALLNTITSEFRFDSWENTDKIADYLLANGVIVPPCKIGTPIYRVCGIKGNRQTPYVRKFQLTYKTLKSTIEDFGKTVFLTYEEAERVANGKDDA